MTSVKHLKPFWNLGGLTRRQLLERVWRGIYETDLLNRAYELAFNFLFAVFPLLFFLIAVLGLFASQGSQLRTDLFFYLRVVLPPDASQLVDHTFDEITKNSNGGKLTFGLLLALYSGSAGVTQLISTLNAAYRVPERRSWLRVHLISLGLTTAMAVLIITALVLVFFGGQFVTWMGRTLGLTTAATVLVTLLRWTLALAFVILAFAAIYHFAPDLERRSWQWITPGSTVGILLCALASAGFRLYVHLFGAYRTTYGSLGAVMILMIWFYVAGLAMLIGGQINATIERAAAEGSLPYSRLPDEKPANGRR